VKQQLVLVAGIPAFFLASVASAALVTETFDSAASATANGWTALGDGVNGQVVGWSNTSDAGGTAGEGRAQLTKGWPARDGYRDLTIGGAFNINNAFSFSGQLDVFFNNTDVEAVNIGYSSTTTDHVAGIMVSRDNTTGEYRWGVIFSSPIGSNGTSGNQVDIFAGLGPTRTLTSGVDRTFTFSYDPAGNGGLGTVTASVSGAGDPVTVNLSSLQRTELGDTSWNAFGINRIPLGLVSSASNQADFRLDNLTYTVVPEPTATAALLLGTSLLARRRRRHT
jgi:hypothetical protein